ncbi:hypothetical protein [Labedaea rhizosphaerae]|uniref:Uncharacterized protein n=1 Tax=Labedaea rhizosphaerae TaxID=598644 RepID=A0A4R6SN85_LABRH|nr:hypothetical protein [Labedaea rhizosphaerae]TDQ04842.1 hypothetical protein EV186_101800 [Labedaea rhizosphaerae]
MRTWFGNAGWIRIEDSTLSGTLYIRFGIADDKRPVMREIYLDGNREVLSPALLRQVRFDLIEAIVSKNIDRLERSIAIPGSDLHRLAAHYGTSWGSGTYAGESCDVCGGPVKHRTMADGTDSVRAVRNWAALSWYAQFDTSGIPQVPMPRDRPAEDLDLEEFPDVKPPSGGVITDDFLAVVRHAYNLARAKRLPPAPTIGKLANVSPRTVHKWVAKARERGIMPRGSQGRIG